MLDLKSLFITFFCIFTATCFAQSVDLKPDYCIDGDFVYLDDIVSDAEKKILIKTPKKVTKFKIPTIKVIEKLEQNGYEVDDFTSGMITFDKYCDAGDLLGVIKSKLKKTFEKTYPNLEIKSFSVAPRNPLPADFSSYRFKNILFPKSKLKKANGTFLAHYITPRKMQKTLFFTFEIDAYLPLFKAKSNISNGTILTQNDCEKVMVKLGLIPSNPLLKIESNTKVAKYNIKEGTILAKRAFKNKLLLKRGARVKAVIQEGNMILQTDATTLSGGDKGEMIRVKTSEGKILNALIKSSKIVLIK